MSLVELCAAYERFAKSYCIDRHGKPSDWHAFIKDVPQKLGASIYGLDHSRRFLVLRRAIARDFLNPLPSDILNCSCEEATHILGIEYQPLDQRRPCRLCGRNDHSQRICRK